MVQSVNIPTVYTDLTDRVYEKKLIDFLTRRYGNVMHLVSIHPGESKDQEEIQKKRGIYLYDQDLSLEEESEKRLSYGRLVKISPEEGIDPYQSADIIARKILGHVALLDDADESSPVLAKGKCLAVYSACGGAGVSSLCIAMAKVLAKKGPTLLLPLGSPSFLDCFVRSEKKETVSDLLYSFLVEGEEMFAVRVKEIEISEEDGIHYVWSTAYPEDFDMFLPGEVCEMMRALRKAFQHVILDVPPTMTKVIRDFVRECDLSLEIVELTEEGEAKRSYQKDLLPPPTKTVARKRKPKESKKSLFGGENKVDQIPDLPQIELEKDPDGLLDMKEDSPYMDTVRELTDDLFKNEE